MSVDRPFKFVKDPSEIRDIIVDFLNADPGTEYEVSSVDVKAYDKAGTDVTSTIMNTAATSFSGNRVIVWTKAAGTNKQVYKIEVLATMTTGQKLMKRMFMTISD